MQLSAAERKTNIPLLLFIEDIFFFNNIETLEFLQNLNTLSVFGTSVKLQATIQFLTIPPCVWLLAFLA